MSYSAEAIPQGPCFFRAHGSVVLPRCRGRGGRGGGLPCLPHNTAITAAIITLVSSGGWAKQRSHILTQCNSENNKQFA